MSLFSAMKLAGLLIGAWLLAPAWALPPDLEVGRIDRERIALTWTPGRTSGAEPYRVRVASSTEAIPEAEMVLAPVSAGRIELTHVAGERPYVAIESADGRRALLAERVLPLEGGVNFRDLGGYTTADGATVLWGKLFRSGDTSGLTDADYDYLQRLGIRTVCDFRANNERGSAPTRAERFGEGVAYVAWHYEQIIDGESFSAGLRGPDPAGAAVELMTGFYRVMPTTFAERFKAVFDSLKGGDGLLFHCSAGKDRTGLMAALLLTALDVEETQIFVDYDLTNHVEGLHERRRLDADGGEAEDDPAMAMFASLPPDAIEAFMGVRPEYLQAAFDSIRAEYGSIDAYLQQALDVSAEDRRLLRARYLEPAPAR